MLEQEDTDQKWVDSETELMTAFKYPSLTLVPSSCPSVLPAPMLTRPLTLE